ncbi:MAG TPA: ADP-glyceromanno-heptose 6-epimerase [Thiotrichaceae bacterium]|jgi:ADP-L-glycero-D-manno-heptose 6-epimerase|nr:ADP-glyceromanno-heptose 6-epimerase [Thiotrichaceae bacterium]HIM08805.1 ADP-glyceromanno-heptose 6-epimerase [Gammaproteobacteria bacterium]
MIVVTGGAGFIGCQLVAGLNKLGREDILVVDDLSDGKKFENLVINNIADYMDKTDFRRLIEKRDPLCDEFEFVFHQGACSTTTEWDGQYMMDNNYSYSKELLHFCLERSIPFVYASSAAVYGVNTKFTEEPDNEFPVNVYGYSKLLFDNYVRRMRADIKSQVVGLRYFNVYGAGEAHKKGMASVVFHFNNQIKETGELKLFEGSHGYADGEQLRDFISVDDIVNVNLWMMDNPKATGVFNVGTGMANSFNDIAKLVVEWHGKGNIKYIPFPDALKGSYQSFTEASLTNLRAIDCKYEFTSLKEGVNSYLDDLNSVKPLT